MVYVGFIYLFAGITTLSGVLLLTIGRPTTAAEKLLYTCIILVVWPILWVITAGLLIKL